MFRAKITLDFKSDKDVKKVLQQIKDDLEHCIANVANDPYVAYAGDDGWDYDIECQIVSRK